MSWGHIYAAFNYKGDVGETALHLLLRIAYEIRENDYAYPGTAYLAEKMHVSRKTVQRALRKLVDVGALDVRSGRLLGHKNHYYLTLPDAPQGRVCPTPVGQIRPDVGQSRPEGWGINDPEEGNKDKETQKTARPNREAQNVPPPASAVHKLSPIGTLAFKAQALRAAEDAGASPDEALKFYEHHAVDAWRVLDRMPLEIAAAYWIRSWKRRDPKAYLTEQLVRFQKASAD